MEKSIINVKRTSCLLLMLIGLVGSIHAQERVTMLVGTYTGGGSKGVYSYRFNQSTGDAVILDSLEISNPSFLTIAPNKQIVYAVSETNDAHASLNAIRLNRHNRTLTSTVLASLPTGAMRWRPISAPTAFFPTACREQRSLPTE